MTSGLLEICSGDLVIAEVVSRLTDLDRFINVLKYLGFRLLSKVRYCAPYSRR